MEASALPASVGLGRTRIVIGGSLLRIRSDEQLVTLFRDGNEDAFRVIHDRYRARLFAYTRQMLAGSSQDPEDAVQEIFMRAYYGLRANDRQLALRAWLYRIAHNRCIDDLRRNQPIAVAAVDSLAPSPAQDPVVRLEQRDALKRLIADVQRLPDQQRSALLMRELSGMAYADVSGALGVSVPAVKSLLVRARVSLAQANEARDTACARIREDLICAHDRGVRASGLARRHMRECKDCRQFRSEVRGVTRTLAALTPTLGPLGVVANLLGFGGGGGAAAAGSSAAAGGGGAAAAAGTASTGAAASAGLLAGGAGHVVTLLAAAVVTAGGAVELQKTLTAVPHHRIHHVARSSRPDRDPAVIPSVGSTASTASTGGASLQPNASTSATTAGSSGATSSTPASTVRRTPSRSGAGATIESNKSLPITETLDPDNLQYANLVPPQGTTPGSTITNPGSTNTGSANPGSTNPGSTNTGATSTPTQTPSATAPGTPGATGTSGPVTTTGSSTSGTAPGTTSTTTPTGATTGTGSTTTTGTTSSGTGSSGTGSTGTGSTGTASSSTAPAQTTGSTGAPATSSGSTSGTTAGTSVGSTTAAAGAGKVVNLLKTNRRHHRRIVVGRLLAP